MSHLSMQYLCSQYSELVLHALLVLFFENRLNISLVIGSLFGGDFSFFFKPLSVWNGPANIFVCNLVVIYPVFLPLVGFDQ